MITPIGRQYAVLALIVPMVIVSVLILGLTSFALADDTPATPTPEPLPALPIKAGRLAADWQSTDGPYERVVYALALGSSPEVLYVGTWGNGLYRTGSGGSSWQPTSPPGEQDGLDPTKAQVRALAVSPDSETIYLSRWNSGLFRSTDRGVHWEGISGFANRFRPCHNNWNADVVLIDQKNPDIIYEATWGGIYTSTNAGNTWGSQDVAPGVPWAEKPVYALNQDSDTLYAGTFGAGVFRSIDIQQKVKVCEDQEIKTWEAIGPPGPALARRVYSLAKRDNTLWAGTQDGVYRTEDGGLHWQRVITGFADNSRARMVQALALDDNGILYAGTIDFGVYRSEDNGDLWQSYNKGLRGYALAILSLVYDGREDVLYATTYGADGVYRNRNDGNGWEPIDGDGDGRLPPSSFEVQSLAFADRDQETLLAGTFVGGLYASNNRGQPWQRRPYALPVGLARDVADIVVVDNDGQTIVIAAGTGIFRSTDGGVHGIKITDTLPIGEYRAISLAQGHRDPDLLYTALDLDDTVAIYCSHDGGKTWEPQGVLSDNVQDLALGKDDQTLFAASLGKGIFQSNDQGSTWKPLGKDPPRHSVQMIALERNLWQRWVLGFQRQSLHVLALDGIYSAFDDEDKLKWQPALSGRFETIMADPVRPGVLYATSVTNTIPSRVVLSQAIAPEDDLIAPSTITDTQVITTVDTRITQPYAFWVSLDDGASWQQASFSDQPLTVLALDPANPNRLLAGTRDGGVYYTTLNLPSPYARGRAVLGLIGFVITPSSILGALLGMYLYFYFVLELKKPLPWQVWALLLRIRAWRLVSSPRDELGAEKSLVASIAAGPGSPYTIDTMWSKLQSLGIAMSPQDAEIALLELRARRLLVHNDAGEYHFALFALSELVQRNFDQQKLIDQVRNANLIARNTHDFFEQAGFQVTPLLRLRLSLWPESPQYRVLGRLNVWLHTDQPLGSTDVVTLANSADSGSRDLGFVVIDHIPQEGAYQALQNNKLIPLSSSLIQRAVDRREARLSLEQAIREGRSQEDLFDRREPLQDHLTHFGRTDVLDNWLEAIKRDEDIHFWGLPRSGRTSALWRLRTDVPGNWLKGYVNLRYRGTDWQSVLRNLVADLLLDLRRTQSMLLDLPELGDVMAECGPELNLDGGLSYLAERGRQTGRDRFVLFIDDTVTSVVLDRLQETAADRSDTSLVASWYGFPSNPDKTNGDAWLPPLTTEESHLLLQTIGAQLGLAFKDADLKALDQAAGGHPFLLRQLGSQGAHIAGRPREMISGPAMRPGEWPEHPSPGRFPAQEAIHAYIERQPDDLIHLWQAFPPQARRNMRLLAAGRPVDPGFEEMYDRSGLRFVDQAGTTNLRIGLLAHWLRERRA
ncbi:MAG: hypothetical protein JXA89_15900 [Anaerolineae bacterium]|nr:hypothetical protein [Anaerolineae bacterium]